METQSLPTLAETPKRKRRWLSVDDYLAACETALINAALPDIAPLLAARSYTLELLTDKLEELQQVRQRIAGQKKMKGQREVAGENFAEARALLHAEYIDHLDLARIVFKNDVGVRVTLGLKGRRPRAESAYCRKALLFYNGIKNTEDYCTAMERVGINSEMLDAAIIGYEDLSEKSALKAKASGNKTQAIQQRKQTFAAFRQWFGEFKRVAIIALRKSPQLREKLGWKE